MRKTSNDETAPASLRVPAPVQQRLIFDLSSSACWMGPHAGIVRAQRELAGWLRANAPGAVFAIFDARSGAYAQVSPRFVDAFISGGSLLDTWNIPDPTGRSPPPKHRLPGPLYAALRIRRTTLRLLERVRLLSGSGKLRGLADRLQRRLITERHRPSMLNDDGSRRAHPPPDIALEKPIRFGPEDTLVCTGNGWSDCDIGAVAHSKAESGFRLVVLCYDVIALKFPHYFKPNVADLIAAYWRVCFPAADLVVFNSNAAASDAIACCQTAGIHLGSVAISPLGSDPSPMRARSTDVLPSNLEEGRYALFVSTLEPRKGHELLHRVWLRLLSEGIPQRNRFKLVFVGRVGWQMEAFERTLAEDSRLEGTMVRLSGVGDEVLDLLYQRAAFCLYPSLYEGYGLPVIEAFARGKALLSSDGGSLPEVVREFSPILPAGDEDAWYAALRNWIETPSARVRYEAAIAEGFRHPTWGEAARHFFELVSASGLPNRASPVHANA